MNMLVNWLMVFLYPLNTFHMSPGPALATWAVTWQQSAQIRCSVTTESSPRTPWWRGSRAAPPRWCSPCCTPCWWWSSSGYSITRTWACLTCPSWQSQKPFYSSLRSACSSIFLFLFLYCLKWLKMIEILSLALSLFVTSRSSITDSNSWN